MTYDEASKAAGPGETIAMGAWLDPASGGYWSLVTPGEAPTIACGARRGRSWAPSEAERGATDWVVVAAGAEPAPQPEAAPSVEDRIAVLEQKTAELETKTADLEAAAAAAPAEVR